MKYNIRRDGVVISMDFELGSGCYDKHGKEIFEGDCDIEIVEHVDD